MLRQNLLVVFLATLLSAHAEESIQILDAPENAYWHEDSQSWFVSNLGGGLSLDRDGYGWVTRFDSSGELISPRWIENLDAPTGMAAHDGRLFVADRGCVHEIDIESAKILRVIDLPGSEFINDVAATSDGRQSSCEGIICTTLQSTAVSRRGTRTLLHTALLHSQ